MILSCEEIYQEKPDPTVRRFAVETSGDVGPADIARLCGKIPKPYQKHDDPEHDDLVCGDIAFKRQAVNGHWLVTARYVPTPIVTPAGGIELPDGDQAEQFPPYVGPAGKQPDGSFILSPRAYKALKEAILWSYRSPREYLDKLVSAVSKDCGIDFEVYT